MKPSRSRLRRSRIGKCLIVIALLAIVVPYTLQSIQSTREAARRREIRGGRDPAVDFKILISMRELYPIVPLGDRLAKHSGTDPASDTRPWSQISIDAEKQLIEYEKASHQIVMSYRLSQIHDDTFAQFVKQNGFGQGRMWFGVDWDEILESKSDLLPIPIMQSSAGIWANSSDSQTHASLADSMHLPSLHASSVFDFVSPSRLGVVPSFKVASNSVPLTGMNSHLTQNWSKLPADSPLRPLSVGHTEHAMTREVKDSFGRRLTEWRLSKLELVSLLKSPQPRVYLSNHLPNMKELSGAPTRLLDEFENTSLQKIRVGEHVVIESNRDEIRMLGGIRAASQCVNCHFVHRGDLLGAFSYSLRRSQPTTVAAP